MGIENDSSLSRTTIAADVVEAVIFSRAARNILLARFDYVVHFLLPINHVVNLEVGFGVSDAG